MPLEEAVLLAAQTNTKEQAICSYVDVIVALYIIELNTSTIQPGS